jgi:DNA-binding GntR family transcriptional regulator
MSNSFTLDKVESLISLKHQAHAIIKDAILTLKLEPGSPLVERDVAQQLGISKTPVRDALQELAREGFVIRVPFKGTYVTDVTIADLTEVFQLRAVLEGLAARLAAPLFSDSELDQLARDLDAAEQALHSGDLILCSEMGRRLHAAIIGKANNERLASIIGNLDDHVRRFRAMSDRISGRLDTSVHEHRGILAALVARDPAAAEQAIRDHLSSVLQVLSLSQELPAEG